MQFLCRFLQCSNRMKGLINEQMQNCHGPGIDWTVHPLSYPVEKMGLGKATILGGKTYWFKKPYSALYKLQSRRNIFSLCYSGIWAVELYEYLPYVVLYTKYNLFILMNMAQWTIPGNSSQVFQLNKSNNHIFIAFKQNTKMCCTCFYSSVGQCSILSADSNSAILYIPNQK